MLHYRAHGLRLESNRPIPGLLDCDASDAAPPDLSIRFGETPPAPHRSPWFESPYKTSDGRPVLVAMRGADDHIFLEYADGPTFLIDASCTTVWVTWPDRLDISSTTSYLLGPVLGIVLRLRGRTCLHASAVLVDGRACAFVGSEGAGKSTLAAAFARAGFQVLSDDTVSLELREGSWWTAPGYPRIRLWPDAVSALDVDDVRAVKPGANGSTSRYHLDLSIDNRFARVAAPLGAIYLLEFDADAVRPRIEPVVPAQAVPILAAHTFASRVLDRDRRIAEFQTLTDLLTSVPMRRLMRQSDLAALGEVCNAVVGDVAAAMTARA